MNLFVLTRQAKTRLAARTKLFEKTMTVLLLSCFTGFSVYAQKPLTNSRQSSFCTYIYKLAPADVLNFYKYPDKAIDEKILRNPIDSFKTDKERNNNLPPGNYIEVFAEKNKLQYKLIENHTVYLKLLPDDDKLRFVFLDRKANLVSNLSALVNNKPVVYDIKSGLYQKKSESKKDQLISAEYDGVVNYFLLKQGYNGYKAYHRHWYRTAWNFIRNKFRKHDNYYRRQPGSLYTGFMVFNKPKYKPNDTVKFKACILDARSKKPIEAPRLLIRLRQDRNDNGKVIGYVNSYRDGCYENSSVLNDSLKLTLDDNYIISLEDPSSLNYDLDKYDGDDDEKFLAKRKVYMTGSFSYEDYDLKSIRFKMRTDKEEHGPGSPLSVYLKATDENDLPVPDGRVNLTLTNRHIHQYKNNHVFVPDTLWTHEIQLEPLGETKIVIPDSIFPRADIEYNINAHFLNADNELQSAQQQIVYNINKYKVTAKIAGDTLAATYQVNGKYDKSGGVIRALTAEGDTISVVKATLPCKLAVNPNAASYDVQADSAYDDVDVNKSESAISLNGYRTADSLFVRVNNANKLHFWYSVFAGNKLMDQGQADNLFYKRDYNKQGNVTFLVNYIWGGETKTEKTVVEYRDKILSINVKQPLSVYPGQQAQTAIVVTDINGKPAANADITAWSFTRKFDNYRPPFVPYFGKFYASRKIKPIGRIENVKHDGALSLNWKRWSREIGLDSIAYFRFTHPQTVYRIEEPGNDTITQVAPFVVKDGEIIPVHILYIDERPVYFSQAEQLERYSFRVSPGKHNFRFRTAYQTIKLDSVLVERSKKLIFSLNDDTTVNHIALFHKAPDTLSIYEANLINKYMITVVNNFGWKMGELSQGDQVLLLNPATRTNNGYSTILAGPLVDNYAFFRLHGDASTMFLTESGYSYLFEPGFLKQKSIPVSYPFSRMLSDLSRSNDYTQYALTEAETDSLWQQYLDLRSATQWLFTNKPIDSRITGVLNIGLNESKGFKHPFIKNIIIYRYDDPDYIRIYPGVTTDFGGLEPGKYRLLFLLKGDSYDIIDSISIKPHGINYYDLNIKAMYAKDFTSIKINSIINNRTGSFNADDNNIENDALKLKEAFNDKYFNDSVFGDTMAGQVVGSDDKLPVVGCSVRIKGTNVGAVTDINGRFRLRAPVSGRLVISYIGYVTKEIAVESGRSVIIRLTPSSSMLNEVVVTGYATQLRRSVSGSVASVEMGLQGMAAGLSIEQGAPGAGFTVFVRGAAGFGSAQPVYVVDGVLVTDLKNVSPNDINSISVLKDAAAIAIYGIAGSNGVVIITTKKKTAEIQAAAAASGPNRDQSIRKNFSDYAYWQPKLTTDENGVASFTTTFPDDITNWRTFVIAINGQKQSGYAEQQIKSFKPLSATFISPLFAVQGDEITAIGKVTNYNTDPAKLTRTFSYNGKPLKQDAFEVTNSNIDTLNVTAENTDSLTFEYSIKRDNGYFDGERRKIPVIEQGVKETRGVFEALNADTTISMKFDPALGPATFRAEESVLPALAEEAQRLREYKYLCNEQLASKLKGLLAEKRIRAYLGEPFKYEKNILEVIKKLQENRRSQGTWGWWKDTDEELWISLHAVEALTDAQKEGYTIDIDVAKLTEYLVYQLESYRGEDKLTCLRLLLKLKAKVDYPKYFGIVGKEFAAEKEVSEYNKFSLMQLQEQAGYPVKLDSLFAKERHTLFGNVYWGEDGYRFFDNSIQLSVLAYKLLTHEGKHPELLEKIKGYFLEQRSTGEWRNTYESSLILETILPDLLKEGKQVKPASLTITGAKTQTITNFPYTATLTDKQLSISKTGSLPVYVTGYQQFWNKSPEKVSKDFTVDTRFEKNGDKLTKLKGGEPVVLKAEITAKGDADFVMIEIPIPAGCSYENKNQSWGNNEVHREYFKEKVSIFCRKLKQGKYEFTVNLLPRYNGKYTLNPAKAEMMYFPVFYGREGMRKVVIGSLVH